ncbi:MAG TPA: IclR family transcriptional regulator [Terracidiphilus sp.]|nr:IclR family transcriptional regulator [Terracidiphilus sp.]
MPRTKQQKSRSAAHQHVEEPPGENRYFSRAVGKAIQILELLSSTGAALSLNDLSKQSQLTKSSALRLLRTLETLRYIRRDASGHYLSSGQMGAPVSSQFLTALLDAARDPMRRLNMEFGETVSLSVLMNNHLEVVHVVESGSLIRMTNIVGRILPPHASSMGKVITAWQDAETRKRLLQSYGLARYNQNTIVDERTIEEEYALIRSRGYSMDAEETTFGGFCFGVGIFSGPSKVEAAISLSMPTSRLPDSEEQRRRIVLALTQAAAEIAQKLPGAAPATNVS